MAVLRSSYWALDTGDWTVETDGGTVTLFAPDESADLRITTCDFGGGLSRQQLIAWARERVPAGTPIQGASCGEFSGLRYEVVDAQGVFRREWLLTLAELVLVANYSCERGDPEHHRAAVDRMLSSLVDNRA